MRLITTTLALAFLALTPTVVSGAGMSAGFRNDTGLARHMYRATSSDAFRNARMERVNRLNEMLLTPAGSKLNRVASDKDGAELKTYHTFTPCNMVGDLDGPDGKLWYYTSHFDYEEIPPHDDILYTDKILRHYRFDIYDADHQFVGSVEDDMEYREDEVRAVLCDLTPIVTSNFFNTDDKYEVLVGFGVNAQIGVNHYRTLAYQIGGEKKDGCDVVIHEFDELVCDVASSSDGDVYVSFAHESYGDDEDESKGFWDYLLGCRTDVDVYGPAIDDKGPVKIFSKSLPMLHIGGDQESTPIMISLEHDGQLYFVFQEYKKPLYNPYDNPVTADITWREENALNVEFYKAYPDRFEEAFTTTISYTIDKGEKILGSCYGIGTLDYVGDIGFDAPGAKDGKPLLVVTKSNYDLSSDGYVDSYYVYDGEGKLLHTLAENVDGSLMMSDIEGQDRQCLFILNDGYGYDFHFRNIWGGDLVTSFNYQFEDDSFDEPEYLTANADRVADGDSYKYVLEMRVPEVDDENNDIMRVMWIDNEGFFDHIDNINMGQKVQYAQCYINKEALNPTLFNSDELREYMILVKRNTVGTAAQEELIIGQVVTEENPHGVTLLTVAPDERGVLNQILPIFEGDTPMLAISYYDQPKALLSQDFYRLPLDVEHPDSGVDLPVAETPSGNSAEEVYNLQGLKVDGNSELPAGIYIVKSAGTVKKVIRR